MGGSHGDRATADQRYCDDRVVDRGDVVNGEEPGESLIITMRGHVRHTQESWCHNPALNSTITALFVMCVARIGEGSDCGLLPLGLAMS